MRLIGSLNDEQQALTFSKFLQQKGITHQIERKTDADWGSSSYGTVQYYIWIENEDDLNEAMHVFHQFSENPQDPLFKLEKISTPNNASINSSLSTPPPPPKSIAKASPSTKRTTWEKQPLGYITRGLLILCTALFFLSQLWVPNFKVPEQYSGILFLSSPIEKALIFDYPLFYERIYRFFRLQAFEEAHHAEPSHEEDARLIEQINRTPHWPGYYQIIVKEGFEAAEEGLEKYPTFEKIREGQYWRFFTPSLLHADLLHLFFNMMWLIVLGKQIEQRISPFRYLVFILLIAIFSNTAQYLMSGPNFVGFSGVLCGKLAFIWVRQKKAPWEGYQIDRLTLIFMLIFILGMAAVQFFSFLIEKSYDKAISPNIANVAHLTGGLMGYLFGKINFFSWRQT